MIEKLRDRLINWLRYMSPERKRNLLEYLEGIRKVLLISIAAIVIGAIISFIYCDTLFKLVCDPLSRLHLKLYFLGAFDGFYVKLRLALLGGLVVAFPVIAFEVWRFIRPAIPPKDRKYVMIIFPTALLLFVGGCLLGYFAILPAALYFLLVAMGTGLNPVIAVDDYLSKLMAFTIPFGMVFELPVVVFFLTRLGILRANTLSRVRKYAILIIFIVAAVLTPGPDPVSQCLLAIPMWLLYESSIIVSKLAAPKVLKKDLENDTETDLKIDI